MHRKLKAFTLLELLVAMAITGLVISIAGIVYNMLGSQFYSYGETNGHISSVFALNNRIKTDFMDASSIEKSDEGMIVKRTKRDPVQYLFTEKDILRSEPGKTDTFHIATEDVQFLFKQEVQEQGIIDELLFEAVILEERERLHFIKQYGISAELNQEEDKDGN